MFRRRHMTALAAVIGGLAIAAPAAQADTAVPGPPSAVTSWQNAWQEGAAAAVGGWQAGAAAGIAGWQAGAAAGIAGWQAGVAGGLAGWQAGAAAVRNAVGQPSPLTP